MMMTKPAVQTDRVWDRGGCTDCKGSRVVAGWGVLCQPFCRICTAVVSGLYPVFCRRQSGRERSSCYRTSCLSHPLPKAKGLWGWGVRSALYTIHGRPPDAIRGAPFAPSDHALLPRCLPPRTLGFPHSLLWSW